MLKGLIAWLKIRSTCIHCGTRVEHPRLFCSEDHATDYEADTNW